MNAPRTTESFVEVSVDPDDAFRIFTDEMDLWWMRSPISFYDSARAVEMRCERGVGGRIMEIYDDSRGDVRVIGVICAWEPGRCLSWDTAHDDVHIDVMFERIATGTRIRVVATLPEDGRDAGGTAWVRTLPWVAHWVKRRDEAPKRPQDLARVAVCVHYRRPAVAAHWLVRAFGFEHTMNLPSHDESAGWIEFHVGNSAIILLPVDADQPATMSEVTHTTWVFVDDLDAHLARAVDGGATIVEPIHQHGYRAYVAADLEGRRWTFAQARPTM
jgi:uncharacterized glyoxalase superfamily protein PhnB